MYRVIYFLITGFWLKPAPVIYKPICNHKWNTIREEYDDFNEEWDYTLQCDHCGEITYR